MNTKQRILFVDDEPKVLRGLERALRDKTGVWEMSYTSSATHAFELLIQEPYDAVVLDIKMPEKSGLDLLGEIKADARTRDVEVVILTGLQDQSLKHQALDLGAADLLNKPVFKEDLVARLNSVLRTKEYRDQLQARNADLEGQLLQSQKMELIGILASGVMHYLNGILSVIVMDSDFIARFLTENQEVQQSLEDITKAGEHARKTLGQIQKFTAPTDARQERFNLGRVVDGCLELLQFYIPGGVRINWDGPLTSRMVKADVNQMYQMMMNLCINAAHAMEQEGLLKISLTETELDAGAVPAEYRDDVRPGPYVRLEVSDTGGRTGHTPGGAAVLRTVEAQDLASLQHAATEGQRTGEVGIGLAAAQQIARNHGGFISVHTTAGQETCLVVLLPCDL
jgi:DNA-binding NarL/FixJ family response regulator